MILGPLYKVDSKGKIRVLSIEVDHGRYRVISGLEDGAKTTNKWTLTLPKNMGRANATTAEEQATKEAQAKFDKKLREDYFKTKEEAQTTKLFKPQLATESEKVDMDKVWEENEYVLADPKLDGMRLTTNLNRYQSRTGRNVPTAAWIFADLVPFLKMHPDVVLDGELYNHTYHDNFEDLMSLARRDKLSKEDESNARTLLQFHVYDMVDPHRPNMTAEQRKHWLDKMLPTGDRIKLVRYEKVYSAEELRVANKHYLSLGYEGTVIRLPNDPYKNGRSKKMIKIKEFITEEFTIIDILSGKGNRGNIAGKVIVDVNGVEVGCGIRGNWDYCAALLLNKDKYINKEATIRFFEWTEDKSLRFPVCIDVARWEHE